MEVLDAFVARKGSKTLSEDELKVVVGRLVSLLVSAGMIVEGLNDVARELFAANVGENSAVLLRLLGIDAGSMDAFAHAMMDDINASRG